MTAGGTRAAGRTIASRCATRTTHHNRRPQSARTKRVLCDTLEHLASSGLPETAKRREVLPVLWRHAVALAKERAADLPGTAHDELVSTLGERVVTALDRLDLCAPPAQQAAYLDRLLHHALADAGRNLDPFGRGPRALRRRYEAALEDAAQARGALPTTSEQDQLLDDVVGGEHPVLRLIVGAGMGPDEAVAHVTRAGEPGPDDDPASTVVVTMARRQIARAIADHPDEAVREYLAKVAAGLKARRPTNFHRRLGPALPALVASLVIDEARANLARAACR